MKDFAAVIVALVVVAILAVMALYFFVQGDLTYTAIAGALAVISIGILRSEYRSAKEIRHRRMQQPPFTTTAGFPEQSKRDIR